LGGIALWSFSRDTGPQAERVVRPDTEPATDVVQNPTPTIAKEEVEPPVEVPVKPPPPIAGGTTSQKVIPSGRGAADPPPVAVEASRALNALRDDYDDLALRGGVVDDALNQLWEEMKPNSPRLDMVTHQRSLRTNLTRSKDALADRDAAEAKRYLESARADLAVLEQFLNR
jgi:hypothetical protein